MFNKFAAALHHAVEVLAPTQTLLEDFTFHWKSVTHYFINTKDDKKPVQESNIPSHLDNMLALLTQEERQVEDDQTGPCMEYLLQHKILETLHTLGKADCPPGMKQVVLMFFLNLLGKIKQPLLPHVNVYKPVHNLIKVCGEVRAGPTEKEEIQFLCTVCSKLKQHPYSVNFFLELPRQKSKKPRHNSSTSAAGSSSRTSLDDITQPEFSLVNSLIALAQSPDSRIAVKACEGLMLCASLPEKQAAQCIVDHTQFCALLAERLCTLYNALPLSMDPVDVDSVEAKWGLYMLSDGEDTNMFPGKRQLISLLSWYDYCDQVIKEAHPIVGRSLANQIRERFLVPIMEQLLLQSSEVGILTSTAHLVKFVKMTSSPALLDVLIKFILGEETAPEKPGEGGYKLRQRLIDRCDNISDEICIMALKLFETLFLKSNGHIITNLVLRNLQSRVYHGRPAPTEHNNQGSGDSSDQRSSNPRDPCDQGCGDTADQGSGNPSDQGSVNGTVSDSGVETLSNGPESPTLVPDSPVRDGVPDFVSDPESEVAQASPSISVSSSEADDKPNIHKIVNSFLGLMPEEARSSYLTGDIGYDTYLREAHRLFRECSVNCLPYDWPNYATPLELCPNEAFYEGAFLKILLDKLSRMLDQTYEVNLQVTSLLSKICLFPHPHIQEFFLDPYLPVAAGCRTLHSVLLRVVSDLSARIKAIPDFQKQVLVVRKQLMGMVEEDDSLPYIDLLEGVIVLEEFCKELAAIAFVKFHAASGRT
ncbi:protein FAM160B1-like isoform X2 [Patiria miniata]|uniref:FHF complex subunit HOOK-interacting protein C-terminal domain-containing protein n=1 Tax=Patiria miniata TaxID=46514 RepID=A0A914B4Y7_PATMI|nr:protein FAM160B1-like isoform X2 [Patiria miniata]